MTFLEVVILCLASVAAGAINSIAGGGTLLTFPALLSILGPQMAVVANATNTIALCPGSAMGAWGYRRELRDTGPWKWWLLIPSIVGGLIGALLLARGSDKVFESLVPWLILGAALLFLVQPALSRWIGLGRHHDRPSAARLWAIIVFQFFVAVYGGYFGAGIGILMLCALALMGIDDIHRMNALKTLLAACINGIAIVVFIHDDVISWPHAVPMIFSGMLGGYLGARVARTMNPDLVRRVVVVMGFVLAAFFFYEQWREKGIGERGAGIGDRGARSEDN